MDKFILKSKTVLGALIAALPTALALFGLSLVPGASEDLTSFVNAFVTLAGSTFAIYGRYKAGGIYITNK